MALIAKRASDDQKGAERLRGRRVARSADCKNNAVVAKRAPGNQEGAKWLRGRRLAGGANCKEGTEW